MITRGFRRAVEQVVGPRFVPLAVPLTSASWNGNAYSSAAKTLIDLSAVFAAPANVKAVMVQIFIRDSGSAAAGNDNHIALDATNTADRGPMLSCAGLTNDCWARGMLVVPCDANGDIYYQTYASGAGTLDVYLMIWGYFL
jgi:hypothetical protein